MADASARRFEPQAFDPERDAGPVAFDEVRVQRSVETDAAGISRIHVWVTGRIVARDDEPFERLEANIAFSLFDGDSLIGICAVQGVVFEPATRSQSFVADEDLHIGLEASITSVDAQIEVTKTVRLSSKVALKRSRPD